jgi:hypothetical protein
MAKFASDFGTALLINVLEHVDRPEAVIAHLVDALKSRGTLNVMVPAHRWLFGEVDRRIGHRQRFEKAQLVALLERAGLEIVRVAEFNRIGMIGWWLNKTLGTSGFRVWQMRLFVAALPVARLLERIRLFPGLSLVAVARKP